VVSTIGNASPALRKEFAQHLTAFFGKNAAGDLGLVIQFGLCEQVEHATGTARFGVMGAEYYPLEASVQDCAYAHHAGLQRDVKLAVWQAIVAPLLGRLPQRHDFGVRGRVMASDRLIEAGSNHLTCPHNHCADRDFPHQIGIAGLLECHAHENSICCGLIHSGRLIRVVFKFDLKKR